MHLDRRTVSRKTPRDGKLEISEAAAAHLAQLGGEIPIEWNGSAAQGVLSTFACSCGGTGVAHDHHFLQSPILMSLPVGADVDLILRAGTVQVAVTPSA